jgi:hypothetical protein
VTVSSIRLIEALPHIILFDDRGEQRYAAVRAFDYLIQLYEREGFLYEALNVAQRAARFYPDFPQLQQLEQRVANVAAETSG